MTTPVADILAASDFESLAFTIIVAAIMGIGAIVSAAKKKQKELEQRQAHQENWQRIEQEMRERAANAARVLSQQQPGAYPQAPPPVPAPYPQNVPPPPPPVFAPTRSIDGPYVPPRPRPAPRRPVPPPVRAQPPRPVQTSRPQPRRPKQQKKAGQVVAAMVSGIPPLPTEEEPTARVGEAPPVARKVPPVPAANAAAIAKWLSAGTLRSQFILTEILQPPLALREPSDRHV